MRILTLIFLVHLIGGQLICQEALKIKNLFPEVDSNHFKITDSKIIKFYYDSIKDYEIELIDNKLHFTQWENSKESEIYKTDKFFDKINDSKNFSCLITYKNGDYEKGNYSSYFRSSYRNGIWRHYDSENTLISSGKYKRYIIIFNSSCLFGEGKDDNYKHGKWKYYSDGKVYKIIKFQRDKIKKTKLLTVANTDGIIHKLVMLFAVA